MAVQIGTETHAQANVEIGVDFGVERIRNALVQSLCTAKVEWLHRPAKGMLPILLLSTYQMATFFWPLISL